MRFGDGVPLGVPEFTVASYATASGEIKFLGGLGNMRIFK